MIKNLLACTAAAVLAFAPVAVQAGTRAADAAVSLDPIARQASPIGAAQNLIVDDDDDDEIWPIFIFGSAAATIFFLLESREGFLFGGGKGSSGLENEASPATGG